MAAIQIIYWRDIPAQVTAKAGRKRVKRPLNDRFMAAIDMAAMRAGLRGSDDYLNEWRKSPPEDCDTDMAEAVARIADDLEQKFNQQVLHAMIDNFGFTPNDAQ